MKRFMRALKGFALIAGLFSMPIGADDAPSGTPALPAAATAATAATISESLVNTDRQNVQMTLASASPIDPLRDPSRMDFAVIPVARLVPDGNGGEATVQEAAGEIWMFLGAFSIALMIAWRRCRWASLRGGSAISTGQRSPHPPQHRPASPIGLSAGHGHLPFGG